MALLLLAAVSALLCAGCSGNKFEVEFQLPESVNSTYRIVYYASDKRGGVTIESAVAVAKGVGKLEGITRLPVCVWIYEGSSKRPSAMFYAERGDKIRISGKDADPRGWLIEGNKESERISEWRLAPRSELTIVDGKKINAAVERQVKEHPEDIVSALIADTYYDERVAGADYARLMSRLQGDAASEEIRRLSGRLPTAVSAEKKLVDKLIFQGLPTGSDTVRPAASKALLLLFRGSDSALDSEAADSIKSLRRQRPDTAAYRMVELVMAADSLLWRTYLRRDTLPGVLRARLALEHADPLALKLGIDMTPWIVVADRSRKIIYSGSDAAAAAKAWKKIK